MGDMIIVRYADDIIVGFEHEADAWRFLDAMRRPIHAAKCRAEVNALGSGTKATIVAAVIGPTPGIVASRRCVIAPNLGNDLVFQYGYTLGGPFDLVGQHFERHPGNGGKPVVSLVANDTDQRLSFPAPLAAT
jgi:hypothetical protein